MYALVLTNINSFNGKIHVIILDIRTIRYVFYHSDTLLGMTLNWTIPRFFSIDD